jgi:hypothetical protein
VQWEALRHEQPDEPHRETVRQLRQEENPELKPFSRLQLFCFRIFSTVTFVSVLIKTSFTFWDQTMQNISKKI